MKKLLFNMINEMRKKNKSGLKSQTDEKEWELGGSLNDRDWQETRRSLLAPIGCKNDLA